MLLNAKVSLASAAVTASQIVRDFFSRGENVPSRKPRRVRLWLERLEDRIVPSTDDFWYGGVSTDWNDPRNWSDGVPTAASDVQLGSVPGQPATYDKDCTLSVPGGVTINSLILTSGYTHTLTLNAPLTVNEDLTVRSGNISQPNGTTSTLTCYGPLYWLGGTIGSQTNSASNFNLAGEANTYLVDYRGPNKILGDNLDINSGTLDIAATENNQVILTNNANITNYGTITLECGASGITNADGSNGVLTNYSIVDVTGSGSVQCIPTVNSGQFSQLTIGSPTNQASLAISGSNPQNGVSFLNNGGMTTIYSNSRFAADQGITQQAGTFDIAGTAGSVNIGSPSGSIPDVNINGGVFQIDSPTVDVNIGRNFTVSGATLILNIDAGNGFYNSILANSGSISIINKSTITVNTTNIPPGGMPKKQWDIFYSASPPQGSITVAGDTIWNSPAFNYGTGSGPGVFWLQS